MSCMPTTRRLVLLLGLAACGHDETPDLLVLHNGKVFTADTAAPWAEALLIGAGRIVAVGTNQAVLAAAPSDAFRVDLGGRTVVPGFNDAHDHVAVQPPGVRLATAGGPLPDPPFAEVADSLRAAAARAPAGTWLRVAIGERVLSDPSARLARLDVIAPEHPVALEAWTGHGVVYNSAALRALGVDQDTRDPLGGRFERDRAGRLTGLAEEYVRYARASFPADSGDSAISAAFRQRARQAIGWGITSIQNMVMSMDPEVVGRVSPHLNLPIRLRLIRMPLTTPDGRATQPWTTLHSSSDSAVVVAGTKWILDGTPVERLALMRTPYADRAGWYGRLNFPPDTIRAMLREAIEASEQPLLHVVGDSATALALQLMTELAPDSVWQRLRPRFEHADGLIRDQHARARQLGVIVVQNPSHFTLGPGLTSRLGRARASMFQPLRSLLESGIVVALGSDGPVNPFLNLMLATMHPGNPAEALTMEQAVRAYTWGSAFAEHAENRKGRLAVDQLADLAVLSQDIFTVTQAALPGTTSVLTLVGGRAVHDPEGRLTARPVRR